MRKSHRIESICQVDMLACIFISFIYLFQTGTSFNQNLTAMDTHQVVPDVIDVAPANTVTVRND